MFGEKKILGFEIIIQKVWITLNNRKKGWLFQTNPLKTQYFIIRILFSEILLLVSS